MNMKKLMTMLLSAAMVLSLAACGGSGNSAPAASSAPAAASGEAAPTFEKMTWSAATAGAEGSNFAAGLEKFAELMSEKTGGAVTVEVYPSDQLTNGNQVDSLQAVMDGTIDMAFQAAGIWSNFNPIFSVNQMPFLFSTYEDAYDRLVYGDAGEYEAKLLEEEFGVKCLGIGDNGFRYITNSKRPVTCMADLAGMKLRVGGSPLLLGCYEAWGADYTTANWAEVYTGLQTGLYDGQENPVAVVDASSIQEVQKYVTSWTANYSCMFMTMNGDLYNSLSPELQAIVDEAGAEACKYQVELTRQECDECLQKWVNEYGLELTELTQEAIDEFKAAAAPVYEEFAQYDELIQLLSA